jgi:luciferase family oxidoreductase group 1
VKLSVLDLMTVRTGQTTADALAASIRLVRLADQLGYHRYWVAEHHNMPSVGSTNPPVLIALLASRTERIRVGSGGVMLPNHAPLLVAEQFALLEAAAPGRIDLGIGRAPGSDAVVSAVLGRGLDSTVDDYPANVRAIAGLLSPQGAAVRLPDGREYELRATPAATTVPQVWLLGSSDYSAALAATLSLPYVFASHFFAGAGTDRALALYRERFVPSDALPEPRTLVTANAVVAPTEDQARLLARPQLQRMAFMRSGRPMAPLSTVEEAERTATTPLEDQLIDEMSSGWVIGEPAGAAARLRQLADRAGTDEVMVVPAASAHEGDPVDRYAARERTLELLAGALA